MIFTMLKYCLVECTGAADELQCSNDRCYNASQHCDYYDNCVDEQMTDESNCGHPPGRNFALPSFYRTQATEWPKSKPKPNYDDIILKPVNQASFFHHI